MNRTELLADVLKRNFGLLKMTIEDFSEADMLVRPHPKANHTTWQLGHLFVAESMMVNGASPGKGFTLPSGIADKFTKETSVYDQREKFCSKSELMDLAESVRKASIEWVLGLSDHDFVKPGPQSMIEYIPTVGHLTTTIAEHLCMHLGQIQVIRRVLGKPYVM